MNLQRYLLLCIYILYPLCSSAQFTSAIIGVNGLTCSACTRTVEMSIRKLDFVKDVEMNLENTEGKIIFKENSDVDISKLAGAVTDAGFSVRNLIANYIFHDVMVGKNFCFNAGKFKMQFISVQEKKLNGEVPLIFLGKDFQSKSELKKVKSLLEGKCVEETGLIYFVTL